MTRALVLAHYNESLDWLAGVNEDTEVYVYDKGNSTVPGHVKIDSWISLPNVGREATTYLYHIVTHYSTLADLTFFFQADPFPHVEEPVSKVNADYAPGFHNLSKRNATDNQEGSPSHCGLPIGQMYSDMFQTNAPDSFTFGAGACFAVDRETIRHKPREWYSHALDLAEGQYRQFAPWCLERMWPYIFRKD